MTAAHQWKQTHAEYRRILRGLYWRGVRAPVERRVQEISMQTIQKCTAILAALTFAAVICSFARPPVMPTSPATVMLAQSRSHVSSDDRLDDLARYVDAQDASVKDRLLAAEAAISAQGKLLTEMNNRQIIMQTQVSDVMMVVKILLGLFSAYLVTKLNKIFGVFFKP